MPARGGGERRPWQGSKHVRYISYRGGDMSYEPELRPGPPWIMEEMIWAQLELPDQIPTARTPPAWRRGSAPRPTPANRCSSPAAARASMPPARLAPSSATRCPARGSPAVTRSRPVSRSRPAASSSRSPTKAAPRPRSTPPPRERCRRAGRAHHLPARTTPPPASSRSHAAARPVVVPHGRLRLSPAAACLLRRPGSPSARASSSPRSSPSGPSA